MRYSFYLVLILMVSLQVSAQTIPLNQQFYNEFNVLTAGQQNFFTGYRTADWLELKYYLDSATIAAGEARFGVAANQPGTIGERITRGNWVHAHKNGATLTLDPIVDAVAAIDNRKFLYTGTLGLRIRANVRDKLSFTANVWATRSKLNNYLNSYIIDHEQMVPGNTRAAFNGDGSVSFENLDAHLAYVPNKHLTLAAGYGKQFIGDGYRSLLLSDNANNNPYIRFKASLWKLHYNATYNYLVNDRMIGNSRQGKYSVNHYLGMNIGKRFQLGLFENVVWVARDTNYQRGFEFQYLQPFTFIRPIEYSLGSPDNSFLGFNLKYQFKKGSYLYGQLALDDINISATFKNNKQHINNKYGIQLGFYTPKIFTSDLSWRFEWNTVRPYMYGHRKIEQNYTHNHQSLTHPMAANFHELISIFNYTHNRWFGVLHNSFVIRGEDPGLSYNNGEDLWGNEAGVPELGSKTLQGEKVNYFYNRASLGYLINPVNRLSVQADAVYRGRSGDGPLYNNYYLGIGIRTGLFNRYDDL